MLIADEDRDLFQHLSMLDETIHFLVRAFADANREKPAYKRHEQKLTKAVDDLFALQLANLLALPSPDEATK